VNVGKKNSKQVRKVFLSKIQFPLKKKKGKEAKLVLWKKSLREGPGTELVGDENGSLNMAET